MKKFLLVILMMAIGFITHAQIYQDYSTSMQYAGLAGKKAFLLPDDTVKTTATNVDPCRQIAKKSGVIYTYDCNSIPSKWIPITVSLPVLLDSGYVSKDTIYLKRSNGQYLVLNLDFYTKAESDNRYVLSPSGKLTANWIQAWDYAVAADVPNIANPDLKYLIVNGSAGDSILTVTGGTGTFDFTPNFAAAAFDKTGNHYFSFFVIRQSGSTYHTDRPLKYNLVNDTIKFMWSSYQGQHMTDFGYRGYADMIYEYHKNLASKDYKLYSFYPEDNPAVPFTMIGGAGSGGFISGTNVVQLFQITTKTINYSQIATVHLAIQQGGAAGKGGEWTVNLGKKNGYLETFVGVDISTPGIHGFARVLFYLDGVLKKVDTVRGAVKKLTYNYTNASSGKIQIVTGDDQNTSIRVGRTIWYQTDLDTISKAYTGGKILFVGDSWTQHYLTGGVFFQSSPVRFRQRVVADGGNASDVINVGRGGMTSAWGKYFFKSWLTTHKPKFVYIEFYINDANSSSFVGDNSNTSWNFNSADPYSAGTDVDGKVSQQQWIDNLKWMRDTALKYGVTPIILMNTPTGSLTQTQGQSGWFSALRPANQYYDIETFFTSGVFADNSVNAPTINATTANLDTINTKVVRGGSASTSLTGSFLIGLKALNSSITKGMIIYPEVNYTGSSGKLLSVQNVPTIGSGEVFSIANNGLTTSAVGFSAGVSGYVIPPFSITYNAGIARISATNSTTVQDLYVGDSLTGVIRSRIPHVLANYTTATLPTTAARRVKSALVYDTDLDKPAVTNGAIWEYLAKESLVNARFDSITAKGRFVQTQFTSAQTGDFWLTGSGRLDGNLTTNAIISPYLNTSSGVKEVKNPNGAYYVNMGTSVTGAIIFKMPFAYNSTMMSIKLKFYDNSGRGGEIIIGGYNFSTPAWLNTFATVIGQNNFNSQVRLGHDGTTNVIIIGDVGTTWNSPKIYVEDMLLGATGTPAIWSTGWSTSLVTDLTGYTLVTPSTTNTLVRNVANGVAPLNGSSLVPTTNLGTGTADNTTFLRGDNTWASAGTVSSVDATVPSGFSISGNPITSSGTLAITYATGQPANRVLGTPDGITGALSLRALVANDIPSLDAGKITTGTINTARLGSGTANNTTYLRGDGTWQVPPSAGNTWATIYSTGDYTLLSTDQIVFSSDNTAPAPTYTLPTGATAGVGKWYLIGCERRSGILPITLSQSVYMLDGTTTTTINPGNSILIISDGVNWRQISGETSPGDIRSITSNTTLLTSDLGLIVDGSSSSINVTLPDATTVRGRSYFIKRIDNTIGNTLNLVPVASQTIDGGSAFSTNVQWKAVQIMSDGSNWYITASNP